LKYSQLFFFQNWMGIFLVNKPQQVLLCLYYRIVAINLFSIYRIALLA